MSVATVQLAVTELLTGTARVLPAQSDPDPQPGQNGTGAEFGKSAPIALVVILLLLIALVLLIRSMNRHVKKMPESFDEPVARKKTVSRPLERTGEQDKPHPDS